MESKSNTYSAENGAVPKPKTSPLDRFSAVSPEIPSEASLSKAELELVDYLSELDCEAPDRCLYVNRETCAFFTGGPPVPLLDYGDYIYAGTLQSISFGRERWRNFLDCYLIEQSASGEALGEGLDLLSRSEIVDKAIEEGARDSLYRKVQSVVKADCRHRAMEFVCFILPRILGKVSLPALQMGLVRRLSRLGIEQERSGLYINPLSYSFMLWSYPDPALDHSGWIYVGSIRSIGLGRHAWEEIARKYLNSLADSRGLVIVRNEHADGLLTVEDALHKFFELASQDGHGPFSVMLWELWPEVEAVALERAKEFVFSKLPLLIDPPPLTG